MCLGMKYLRFSWDVSEIYFTIYDSFRPHFPKPWILCQMFIPVSHECKLHIKYQVSVGFMIYVHYQPSRSHRAI